MANYLITGGAGFIGSNIAIELIKQNHSVRILDNLATGRLENLDGYHDKIEFISGDLRNLSVVRKAVDGVDYVLHQGALPSVARSIKDPIASNEANTTGTLNVLVAARDAGVKRVIYASSSSIYGNTPKLPKREDMPANPISPYAISKYSGEQYCRVFTSIYGLETAALRYFNVFGPRQNPESQYAAVIPLFINAVLNGEPITIYGDGEQTRDFTYVENVVQANLLACHAEDAAGEMFNIACGQRTSINQLAQIIKELMNAPNHPIIYTDSRPGDVKHSFANISKAKSILGYEPKFELVEGLCRTIKTIREDAER